MHSVLPVRPRFKQTHFGRSLYFSWMDTTRISACHCKTTDFLKLPATVMVFGTRNVSFNEFIELTWWTMRFPVFVLLSMACWLQWSPVSRVLKPTFVLYMLPNCLGDFNDRHAKVGILCVLAAFSAVSSVISATITSELDWVQGGPRSFWVNCTRFWGLW